MKIIKTANGKSKVKLSRKEWEGIGKQAGWMTPPSVANDTETWNGVNEFKQSPEGKQVIESLQDIADPSHTIIAIADLISEGVSSPTQVQVEEKMRESRRRSDWESHKWELRDLWEETTSTGRWKTP